MEQEGKLEIQVWKHDYIYDRSKPNLMQLLGLEEDDKKITYEDIFDAINFDLEGKECKIDGIEDARKLPQWTELNHSNNFELRWCWVARIVIINIFDKDIAPLLCQKIDKWGRTRENRAKFGRILDYMMETAIDEPATEEVDIKTKAYPKFYEAVFDDQVKKSFEDFLVNLAPELFEAAKEMAGEDLMTTGNIFIKSPDQKAIFDKLISNMCAYDWDTVRVLINFQTKNFLDGTRIIITSEMNHFTPSSAVISVV